MDIRRIFYKVKQYGIKSSIDKMIKNQILFLPKKYYSELGEDILLQHYCPQKTGFYVDIGAYHPKRYSVTRLFYKKGWNGINIEANPYAKKVFNLLRRRDININIGVSDEAGELNYYFWGKNDPSNTFDPKLHEYWSQQRGHKAKKIIKIKVDTLNNILEKNLPENMEIDFLTIDVEGFEVKILQTINYEKYAPKLILIEDLYFYNQDKDFMDFKDSVLYKFLNSKGYIVVAKTWYSILFKMVK